MYREYYTLDCVYYEKEPNLIERGAYPAGFSAIIEHENGERVEEEMWKLLMWRGPLKVLIFYDYLDDAKQQNKKYADWLERKFKEFGSMAKTMHQRHPEGSDNQYLFVVGSITKAGERPVWRYYRLCQTRWIVEVFE